LESARAPDAFAGKADESAVSKTFEAAGLFLFMPTYLALMDRVVADFEAGLVAGGRFALALVIRISVVAGHPSRPTAAAPQWPKAGGAGSCEPVSSRYERYTNAPLPQQSQSFSEQSCCAFHPPCTSRRRGRTGRPLAAHEAKAECLVLTQDGAGPQQKQELQPTRAGLKECARDGSRMVETALAGSVHDSPARRVRQTARSRLTEDHRNIYIIRHDVLFFVDEQFKMCNKLHYEE
jgi:hypothetical protein